ncbi:pentapeptide repeat-containing protein, partial [bacterium]|nr:pentapeptide repeat-containing protein [bacterium]
MTQKELNYILKLHQMWLDNEIGGKRANLSEVDLSGANLINADLSKANLSGANLSKANLSKANLSKADLSGAILSIANLSKADLSGANLQYANLFYVNLSYTNLSGANLFKANLSYADLFNVIIDENTKYFNLRCPVEGSFVGYKKCMYDVIVTLKITEDALRSSATGDKCR